MRLLDLNLEMKIRDYHLTSPSPDVANRVVGRAASVAIIATYCTLDRAASPGETVLAKLIGAAASGSRWAGEVFVASY